MNDENLNEPWREHRDELLEKVTRRGRALKVRRQAVLVTVMTAVLLVPFAAVAATNTQTNVPVLRWASSDNGDGPTDDSTTTTTAMIVSTTTAPAASTTVAPTTTVPGAASVSTTTSTTVPCLNEGTLTRDCGEFRWVPKPPASNRIPVSVEVVSVNEREVLVRINSPVGGFFNVDFGDGSNPASGGDGGFPVCKGQPSGPWTWPVAKPLSDTVTHEYAAGGSFTVGVTITPELFCGRSPYTDGSASTTVTVGSTAVTTTTVPTA